jgi:hypothetical protein
MKGGGSCLYQPFQKTAGRFTCSGENGAMRTGRGRARTEDTEVTEGRKGDGSRLDADRVESSAQPSKLQSTKDPQASTAEFFRLRGKEPGL